MAAQAVTIDIMQEKRGKHWTQEEIQARRQAANEVKRAKPVKLTPPAWLNADAKKIWAKKIREAEGVNLFDVLDEESLAVYCDSIAKYEQLSKQKVLLLDDHKTLQAYSRIIHAYADKMGFTPTARARLVKKRATEKPDDFGKEFD